MRYTPSATAGTVRPRVISRGVLGYCKKAYYQQLRNYQLKFLLRGCIEGYAPTHAIARCVRLLEISEIRA
jgi:hypothetical protein